MRVLAVHNHYIIRSGENLAFEASVQMLRDRGHEVILLDACSSDYGFRFWELPRLAFRSIFSVTWFFKALRAAKELKPDVALVQNVFPLISPSIYWGLWFGGIPIVQRMFNYRPICPKAVLYARGAVCERCVKGNYLNAVLLRCYRESSSASFVLALSLGLSRILGLWRRTIALYLSPDRFLGEKLGVLGVGADRIRLVPNPAPDRSIRESPVFGGRSREVLFIGRLVREKGIFRLLEIAARMPDCEFVVVGSGGDAAEVARVCEDMGLTNVEFRGELYGDDMLAIMESAGLLLVPSQWYDNIPLVVTQGFLAGIPVVASRINGIPEYVIEGETGWLADPGDAGDFCRAIRAVLDDPEAAEVVAREARRRGEHWFMPGSADMALEEALLEAALGEVGAPASSRR